VHMFSNGGGFVYRYLTDLIHSGTSPASVKLCGLIYDSAPCRAHLLRGLRVFMSVWNHSFLVKYVVLLWVTIATMLLRFAECIPFVRIPVSDYRSASDYWTCMCNDPATCPHLYLYSVQDKVVHQKEIEEMIAERRRRGVHVSTQCWDDSAHVMHFLAHRETYVTTCLDFLQRCLPDA